MVEEGVPAIEIRGLSGVLQGRSWAVMPGRPLVLGRTVAPSPDITAVAIPDSRISSEHCRIEYAGGSFRVIDLNSRNGVRINGRRLPRGGAGELRNGDVISLAEVALEICSADRIEQGRFYAGEGTDRQTETQTSTSAGRDPISTSLVPDLLPFPVAMGIRRVRNAMGSLDRVQEALHSFEAMLRFQTLVALSEYLARGVQDGQVQELLLALSDRPFTLGRWLELHTALARVAEGDPELVIPEFATPAGGEEGRWRAAASRLVELRNCLLHGDGISAASTEIVGPQVTSLFGEVVSSLEFWIGYRCLAVEPGAWSDEDRAFSYPCRLLLGCTTPFEACVLRCLNPLPPRVPIVISRDGKRRLSLAPFQAILPAEDKQLHWFWFAEATAQRVTFLTYPAAFRIALPAAGSIRALLRGEQASTSARGDFSGRPPPE